MSADIIASATVAPHDSLIHWERNSDVSIASPSRIFRANKIELYRAKLLQALNQN